MTDLKLLEVELRDNTSPIYVLFSSFFVVLKEYPCNQVRGLSKLPDPFVFWHDKTLLPNSQRRRYFGFPGVPMLIQGRRMLASCVTGHIKYKGNEIIHFFQALLDFLHMFSTEVKHWIVSNSNATACCWAEVYI